MFDIFIKKPKQDDQVSLLPLTGINSKSEPGNLFFRKMDADKLKKGVRVEYRPIGGAETTSTGTIKDIVTHKQPAGSTGVNVEADDEHPRYVIENDNTHKETAYKLENIEKVLD